MPNDRLAKIWSCPGSAPPKQPYSSFNDVVVHDCQLHHISRPYMDAQNRLHWMEQYVPLTYIVYNELKYVCVTIL